jgi:hypothetical protein
MSKAFVQLASVELAYFAACCVIASKSTPSTSQRPRVKYGLRTFISVPQPASGWLKLPAIASGLFGRYLRRNVAYLLQGSDRTDLENRLATKIHHTPSPSEVAQSLFQLNVIPGRTPDGKLVLLG